MLLIPMKNTWEHFFMCEIIYSNYSSNCFETKFFRCFANRKKRNPFLIERTTISYVFKI
ncbi:unknown [Porphyromonas sp. CAG:1061]|nr:unknown [Porphyromonas sp. CAG:1061]